MPVATEEKLKIKCDNPDCPGHELDEADRTGWLFVSGEVYGKPTSQQYVYCSVACLSAHTGTYPEQVFQPDPSTVAPPPAPVPAEE